MLEKVVENWTSRLDYIRARRGSHMPEIIFKIKFVFAPRCRGVSAKRSAKLNDEELRELNDLEETWMDWPKSTVDELTDSFLDSRRKSILQKLFEKFNDYNLREEDN
ncbi:hypothetical protein TNCV_4888481 [Trichonephila clavipes]|nr:hypothetical protein TNCV_4888481 [Trichonephila clavipes]